MLLSLLLWEALHWLLLLVSSRIEGLLVLGIFSSCEKRCWIGISGLWGSSSKHTCTTVEDDLTTVHGYLANLLLLSSVVISAIGCLPIALSELVHERLLLLLQGLLTIGLVVRHCSFCTCSCHMIVVLPLELCETDLRSIRLTCSILLCHLMLPRSGNSLRSLFLMMLLQRLVNGGKRDTDVIGRRSLWSRSPITCLSH